MGVNSESSLFHKPRTFSVALSATATPARGSTELSTPAVKTEARRMLPPGALTLAPISTRCAVMRSAEPGASASIIDSGVCTSPLLLRSRRVKPPAVAKVVASSSGR